METNFNKLCPVVKALVPSRRHPEVSFPSSICKQTSGSLACNRFVLTDHHFAMEELHHSNRGAPASSRSKLVPLHVLKLEPFLTEKQLGVKWDDDLARAPQANGVHLHGREHLVMASNKVSGFL